MSKPWFSRSPEDTLSELRSTPAGLSAQEVQQRMEQYGPNKLQEGKRKSVAVLFLEQFKDLLVIILLIAAVISALTENVESTIVIFAVLILNAVLGTVQYLKAEKSLESLKAMSSPTAKVLRGGVRVEVPSAEVVPGDIVLLEAGDLVVADGRIIENFSLKVNESSLTGESEGVEKNYRPHRPGAGGPGRPEKHGLFRLPGHLWPGHGGGHRHRHGHGTGQDRRAHEPDPAAQDAPPKKPG